VIEVYAFVDLRIVDATQCPFCYKALHHDSRKKEKKEAIYWILRNIRLFF
jgi:hypothetical protein